jgi:hypothetical protein
MPLLAHFPIQTLKDALDEILSPESRESQLDEEVKPRGMCRASGKEFHFSSIYSRSEADNTIP